MAEPTKEMLTAQRDEYKAEADRLTAAGKQLAAALRFYVHRAHDDYRRDPYYKDFYDALRLWDDALGESSR
jgi:hypothetical protein